MDNLIAITDGKEVKGKVSKWKQPGGTLGKVVAVASIVGGGVLLYHALPALIALASNLITLSLLCIAFGAIVILVANKKFRSMFSNLYFMTMRKLTGMVIDIDPVSILKKKIGEMKKKMEVMKSSIISLMKMRYQTSRKLEEKKTTMETNLRRAVEFKKMGRINEANMEAVQANMNKKMIATYTQRMTNLDNWIKILHKLYDYADYTVRKTEMEAEYKSEEFEAIKEQHRAFSTFKSIVKASPEEMEEFTRAMDSINNDMDGKLAEIDYYINNTKSIVNNIDIEKAVLSKEAAELIEKYETGGFDKIFKSFKSEEVSLEYILKEASEPVKVE